MEGSTNTTTTNTAPVNSADSSTNQTTGEQTAEQRANNAAMRRLKLDGREIEVPDQEYDKYAHKGYAADQRFKEAAEIRKQAEARERAADEKLSKAEQRAKRYDEDFLLAALKDAEESGDPQRLNRVRERVERYLADELRKEQMSPEQRALMESEKKRQAVEQRLQAIEKANQDTEHQAHTMRAQKEYEQKFMTALQTGKVPPTERAIVQMVELQRIANERGYELTPERLAEEVRNSYVNDNKVLVDAFAKQAAEAEKSGNTQALIEIGDQIREFFGENIVTLIRKSDLARLRSGQPNVPKPVLETPKTAANQVPQKSKMMTEDEYRDRRRENARRVDAGLPPLPY